MTLDELELHARHRLTVGDDSLARALLDLLPVVRAVEIWLRYPPCKGDTCSDDRCNLARAVDALRAR